MIISFSPRKIVVAAAWTLLRHHDMTTWFTAKFAFYPLLLVIIGESVCSNDALAYCFRSLLFLRTKLMGRGHVWLNDVLIDYACFMWDALLFIHVHLQIFFATLLLCQSWADYVHKGRLLIHPVEITRQQPNRWIFDMVRCATFLCNSSCCVTCTINRFYSILFSNGYTLWYDGRVLQSWVCVVLHSIKY